MSTTAPTPTPNRLDQPAMLGVAAYRESRRGCDPTQRYDRRQRRRVLFSAGAALSLRSQRYSRPRRGRFEDRRPSNGTLGAPGKRVWRYVTNIFQRDTFVVNGPVPLCIRPLGEGLDDEWVGTLTHALRAHLGRRHEKRSTC